MKNNQLKLKELKPIFTAKEAFALGISQYDLNLLIRDGSIEKIRRGVYQKSNFISDGLIPAGERKFAW